ncbi:MAG TPA: hypothetical protein VJR47_22935 [Stellaceae bacterium]|nr:hypothetical protein [Stellaceae bacterium]
MSRAVLLVALSLVLASPSSAADRQAPPEAVERSAQGNVVISSSLCAALGPDATVPGAGYEPGVDVNGQKVAPADLPSSAPSLQLGDFPIEIRKDLAGAFGIPPRGGAYGAKAILGYVTVHGNEAYFNGQPLSGDQRAALIEACRKAKR